jgi:hypothetical protein
MALVILVVNSFLSVLAIVLSVYVYLDRKGERKLCAAAQAAVPALQKRIAAQDEQLGLLTQALAQLVPADARPTAPHHPVGLSRPFLPSPEQVAAARTAWAETQGKPPPPTDGDRPGINPGDPIPSERIDSIRRRFEEEADARSAARAASPQLPTADTDDEPDSERTRVYSGRQRRPTLLGGLAGVPIEKPRSDPTRAAREYKPRATTPSSPTLVSTPEPTADDGSLTVHVERQDGSPLSDRPGDRGTPSHPAPRSRLSAEAERRLAQLVAAYEAAKGRRLAHCGTERCASGEACACGCDDCAKLAGLVAQAVRETLRG